MAKERERERERERDAVDTDRFGHSSENGVIDKRRVFAQRGTVSFFGVNYFIIGEVKYVVEK